MNNNFELIAVLRDEIPSFECKPGCHDCCGPVTASSEEMSNLPSKSEAQRQKALEGFNCVYLGEHGCTVYADRPLICRLFGTTKTMPCPNGCAPEANVAPEIEKAVFSFIKTSRQVLI